MMYVILHNIRSAYNVGAIFRTADGAGVSTIFLTGYTPTPIDRFGRRHPEIEKTSLGATASVAWNHVPDIAQAMAQLRNGAVEIVAVEQSAEAVDYCEYAPQRDVAYIFGNEHDGIPADVCQDADAVIYIPMQGRKESLNVAVAAGIILFSK